MTPLDLLPMAALGAVLGLDVVSFPQAMISRPLVAATLAGAMTVAVLAALTTAWVGGWSMVWLRRLNARWARAGRIGRCALGGRPAEPSADQPAASATAEESPKPSEPIATPPPGETESKKKFTKSYGS